MDIIKTKEGNLIRDITKEYLNFKFDLILCLNVFEHIPINMHKKAINNIKKMMHENTVLILSIPFMVGNHTDNDYVRFTFQGIKSLVREEFKFVYIFPYGNKTTLMLSLINNTRFIGRPFYLLSLLLNKISNKTNIVYPSGFMVECRYIR